MSLVTLESLLKPAAEQEYAVGSFNIVDLEFLEAILAGSERLRSPVIISVAEVHLQFVSLDSLAAAVHALAQRASIPVALNLDHGVSLDVALRAIRLGFTSIMFDGSRLHYEENVRQTQEIVRLCRPLGISVEAELGAVGGSEDGSLEGAADPRLFTDPAQAEDFVHRTGVQALAVAIGNAHGKYKGLPKLDFGRLRTIRDRVGIPLVLHGGSGLSAADFKKAISLGIRKVNFFTGMAEVALAELQKGLSQAGARYNDYPALKPRIRQRVQAVVEEQIRIFGSECKA